MTSIDIDVGAPPSETERFIAARVRPHLAPDEAIVHTGYLIGALHGSGIGIIVGAIGLRACFIALSETRAFLLWSLPGRVGVFRPLLECEGVQVVERNQISAKVTRSLFRREHELWLTVNRDVIAFHIKRSVKSLPGQSSLIDALMA